MRGRVYVSVYTFEQKLPRTYVKRVGTFDDAFGDNRISVSSNDVYRLITTLGVVPVIEKGKGHGSYMRAHRDRYELTTTFVYHESHGRV